jgi:hypothetical protein
LKTATCVLCGRFGSVSREHAPPQGLFLKPKPTNMITVPCCLPCNDKYKLDDEYFRIFVTAGAEPGTKLERLWSEKVINSSLRNSPKLSIMLGEHRDAFIEQNKGRQVRSTTGRLMAEDELHLVQPLSVARINGVVTKIVRCLYFHERKERLPVDAGFVVNTILWTEAAYEIVKNFPTGSVGTEGEFKYRYLSIEPGISQWLLSFYDRHVFDVLVSLPTTR